MISPIQTEWEKCWESGQSMKVEVSIHPTVRSGNQALVAKCDVFFSKFEKILIF